MALDEFLREYRYSEIKERYPDKTRYPLFYKTSAHEYTLEPGEMLFIPAGWFHAIYSEDADPVTGLNFTMNYWYHPENDWSEGQSSLLLPRKTPHGLPNINPREMFGNQNLRVFRSELDGLFPSEHMLHRFNKQCYIEHMTFDEFYMTKNKKYHIIENGIAASCIPKYTKPLYMASASINYGNVRHLIHYDGFDNFLCQFQGKKRVILFPHEDRDLLYMFNPAPLSVINRVKYFQVLPLNYVVKTQFNLNGDIAAIYKDEFIKYSQHKGSNYSFEPPLKFKEVAFSGVYDKINRYPITMLFIMEGEGAVTFPGRGVVNVKRGDLIMFPTHFTHPYELSGPNLKIMVPT